VTEPTPAEPDGARRALMLSGSIGLGHAQLAAACTAALAADGWTTSTLDLMRLLGRGADSIADTVFRTMLAVPGLYDAFHFAALRDGNWLADLTDAAARNRILPKLRAHLDAEPADLVISVFATGASAMSSLAGDYPATKHVVFCTDVTPHRLWVHENVDLYLLTSQAAEQAVRRFDPDARVQVMPAPVRDSFYHPPAQAQARAQFSVPAADRCVLLTTGGWGLGPVAQAAEALGEAGVHVLAVAGQNAKLQQRLFDVAERQPLVHPFGFSDQIPELMAAADLVITSSGDTCNEARVVGRPLLLLDVVPGHGRDNLQHELELGDAAVASGRPADVVRATLSALDHAKPPSAPVNQSPDTWHTALTAALESIGR
jgi:processive 1,2-diacylglycerol beta-glucosyltransferase